MKKSICWIAMLITPCFVTASSMAHSTSFLELRSAQVVPINASTPVEDISNKSSKIVPLSPQDKEHLEDHEFRSPSAVRRIARIASGKSHDKIKELQGTLEKVTHLSNQLRDRITVCMAFICPSIAAIGIFCGLGIIPHNIPGGYFFALGPIFGSLGGAPLMPNDAYAIRLVCLIVLLLVSVFSGTFFLFASLGWFVTRHEVAIEENPSEAEGNCGSASDLACGVQVLTEGFVALACLLVGCLQIKTLRTNGKTVYDFKQKKGFRYRDDAFRMPSPIALETVWTNWRLFMASQGVINLSSTFIQLALGRDRIPALTMSIAAAGIFEGFCWSFSAAVSTKNNRRRLTAAISSVVARQELREAASIAALLGNFQAKDGLAMAKEKFRSISFDHLREEDFHKSKQAAGETDTLFKKTAATELGNCDVFLSHSWSDEGHKKFRALKEWAEDFKKRKGKYPVVWLDKACIDQSDISNDLLCLPIFLAGCENLLIIAGPSYTSRLWCILEVFVFLQMGGTISRVTVLPIDMANEQEAKQRFDSVDVNLCECHEPEDKEKILGAIQKGFVNFEGFNDIIRNVFKERTDRIISDKISFNILPTVRKHMSSSMNTASRHTRRPISSRTASFFSQ